MPRRIPLVMAPLVMLGLMGATPAVEAGEPDGQLLLVQEVSIDPSMADAYEALARGFLVQAAAHGYPYASYGYATFDYRYLWVIPIDRYAEIPEVFAAGENVIEAWDQDGYRRAMQAADCAVRHARHFVIRERPDLSMIPEKGESNDLTADFVYWGTVNVKPGHQGEVEDIVREFAMLYAEKGIPWRSITYEGEIGTDTPVYFYVESGASPGAFWTDVDATHESLGAEAHQLWQELMSHVREYSYATGTFRKDLTYVPTTGAPAEEEPKQE